MIPKSRKDIALYCARRYLELITKGNKVLKPNATYTLSKPDIKLVCDWLKNLKFPDGYASNISNCVNNERCTVEVLKSHDCHVFLQRIMSVAFRDLIPKPVWNTIIELCHFFCDISEATLVVDNVNRLKDNILIILCKLECIENKRS